MRLNYNVQPYSPNSDIKVIPEGIYPVEISNITEKPLENGLKLILTLKILNDPEAEQILFLPIVVEGSPEDVAKGNKKLNGIGFALNLRVVDDTQFLIGKRLNVETKVMKNGQGRFNYISKFLPMNISNDASTADVPF